MLETLSTVLTGYCFRVSEDTMKMNFEKMMY